MSSIIESGADGTGLYFIGSHRLAQDGSTYEVSSESFHISADGSASDIADPPVRFGVGPDSQGIATGDFLFGMIRDCTPGGDPTSGGFSCASAGELRFLRYDVAADAWEQLDLPDELAVSERVPRIIPGQLVEEGVLMFGVPSASYDGAVANQIAVFDTATETWSMLLDEPVDLPTTCTDGATVFHLDGQELLAIFREHRDHPPVEDVVTLDVDMHAIDLASGEAAAYPVSIAYPAGAGFEVTDLLSLRPVCMADGAVLLYVPRLPGQGDVPWPLRLPDGTWTSIIPDPMIEEGLGLWDVVALEESVVFVTTESGSPESPRSARIFDLTTLSWLPPPPMTGTVVPQAARRTGPSEVATIPVFPYRDERPTIIGGT